MQQKFNIKTLVLLLVVLTFFLFNVTEVDALKSTGTPSHKFGQDTKHIVCGDKLCSEINITQTKNINAYFDTIRNNTIRLVDFFEHMPKGADLHNHLAGNTHPDILIQVAIKNNLCFNLDTAKLLSNDEFTCPDRYEFVLTAYENKSLYEFLLQNWSVYGFESSPTNTGHDVFFAVFDKINKVNNDVPSILGHWKIIAEKQNMQYMETMFNDPFIWSEIKILSDEITINDVSDFSTAYVLLQNEIQKRNTIENSVRNIKNYEKDSTIFCMERQYSCNIPFKYIFQILRTLEPNEVFTQMVIGFETAKQSEHFIAVNMVQPEDDKRSLNDYNLHMEMLAFLKEKYPNVHITLHAGELWKSLPNIDKTDMTFHIHDAIQKGNAQRIGHGVDIQTEVEYFHDLVEIILENNIAMEINLNSNYFILNVKPSEHPILFYLENNIPIVLSTDDPGILLSNMTNEYVTAAQNYPQIDYLDFKDIVRNSLEYSFLSGKSLWVDGDYTTKLSQCGSNTRLECWSYVDKKAVLQYELEAKFDEFESNVLDVHSQEITNYYIN